MNHNTYHHFENEGRSDSNIDVLLESETTSEGFPNTSNEKLSKILCSKSNPLIDSSHDALVSTLSFPLISSPQPPSKDNVSADRISPTKHKIVWSEDGINAYQELLSHTLPALRTDANDDLLPGSASVLFQLTTHVLTTAAKMTNKSCETTTKPTTKRPPKIPPDIAGALKTKTAAHSQLQKSSRLSTYSESEKVTLKSNYKREKANYQNLVRKHNLEKEVVRDQNFLHLLSKNPSQVFKTIKSQKNKKSKSIKSLKVGNKI